jgi:hypothetical protein
MPGIFISYRRKDAIAWAGRLFDHLSRRFGKSQVFMDIEGGIPRGADFEQILTTALESCDALLALIGPEWISCKRSDGSRRLDVPDDWVRKEIATALRRNILVVPVLFGSAPLPDQAELPEDLRPLLKRNKAEVTDTRWEYDVGELIKDLITLSPLKPLDDVTSVNTGFGLLKDLITTVPAIADTVSRSKEVIEDTYRQVAKLELFKTLHDALHTIEFECLGPMKAGGATSRLRPFKIKFAEEARRIQECIQGNEMNPALRDDLTDQLELTREAFQAALDVPGDAAYGRAIGELDMLLSSLPPRLDAGIADAAAELNLDRLVHIMTTVRTQLHESATEHGAEIEPVVHGIDALQRLRDELVKRVAEHTQLQRLDSKLRTVCVAGPALTEVRSEWGRIKLVRSRLAPPFSAEIGAVNEDLVAIESEIETAVERDEPAALDLLKEYFRAVSSVFRAVDTSLKEFCMRLSEVSQPLKIILSMF